jgi:hypothetical protein
VRGIQTAHFQTDNGYVALSDSSEQTVPAAPWRLTGSAIVMLTRARPRRGVLLAFVHYETSPVGPYDELARIGLTWSGPAVLEMFVTSPRSREGGRRNWGFPKQLAELQWWQQRRHTVFRAGTSEWRFRACGPWFPIQLKAWTVQQLEGRAVNVPIELSGHARLAFNGKRIAFQISQFEMQVLAPRIRHEKKRRS